MPLNLSIYGAANTSTTSPPPAPPKPKPIEFMLTLKDNRTGPHGKKTVNDPDALILCAVTPSGDPIPDGNLVKIKSDGTLYLYHTVNPALGLPLDEDGCVEVQYND